MRKQQTKKVIKNTHYINEDCSVELYSLTCDGQTETYLRKGYKIEKVEGEVDLSFSTEQNNCMDFSAENGSWSNKGGLKKMSLPKQKK